MCCIIFLMPRRSSFPPSVICAIASGAVAVLTDEAGRRIIEGLTAEGEQPAPMVVVPDPRGRP